MRKMQELKCKCCFTFTSSFSCWLGVSGNDRTGTNNNMNHDIIVWKRRWGLNVPKVHLSLSIFGRCPRCWSASQDRHISSLCLGNFGVLPQFDSIARTHSPLRIIFNAAAGFGRGALSSPGTGNWNKATEPDWTSGWIRGAFRTRVASRCLWRAEWASASSLLLPSAPHRRQLLLL